MSQYRPPTTNTRLPTTPAEWHARRSGRPAHSSPPRPVPPPPPRQSHLAAVRSWPQPESHAAPHARRPVAGASRHWRASFAASPARPEGWRPKDRQRHVPCKISSPGKDLFHRIRGYAAGFDQVRAALRLKSARRPGPTRLRRFCSGRLRSTSRPDARRQQRPQAAGPVTNWGQILTPQHAMTLQIKKRRP